MQSAAGGGGFGSILQDLCQCEEMFALEEVLHHTEIYYGFLAENRGGDGVPSYSCSCLRSCPHATFMLAFGLA
jgi:hypothetical protein